MAALAWYVGVDRWAGRAACDVFQNGKGGYPVGGERLRVACGSPDRQLGMAHGIGCCGSGASRRDRRWACWNDVGGFSLPNSHTIMMPDLLSLFDDRLASSLQQLQQPARSQYVARGLLMQRVTWPHTLYVVPLGWPAAMPGVGCHIECQCVCTGRLSVQLYARVPALGLLVG